MSAAHQAAGHVRAHAAQAYHSQLHIALLLDLTVEQRFNSGTKETLAPHHAETMHALFEPMLSEFRDLHSHRSQDAPEAHAARARPTPGNRRARARLLAHQRYISAPVSLHFAARLPVANGYLHRSAERFWQRRLQAAQAFCPFC